MDIEWRKEQELKKKKQKIPDTPAHFLSLYLSTGFTNLVSYIFLM